eukprot:1213757-Amphidinium_carterae.1
MTWRRLLDYRLKQDACGAHISSSIDLFVTGDDHQITSKDQVVVATKAQTNKQISLEVQTLAPNVSGPPKRQA